MNYSRVVEIKILIFLCLGLCIRCFKHGEHWYS